MNILIKNIDIITGDRSNRFIPNGNIGIQNGYIQFINGTKEELEGFHADKIINGIHRLAMPGLVNTHTHCAMTILRNFADDVALEEWLFQRVFPAEARMTERDVYWGTLLGAAEMIKSGTTTYADMYLHMDSAAEAASSTGMRVNLSRSPLRFDTCEHPAVIDETRFCLDYYKNWHNKQNGRIKVYIEVHSAYLFGEQDLKDSAELARELGTGIQIHVLETLTERENLLKKYGASSVEVCLNCGIFDVPVVAAHCVHLTDEDIHILAEKKVNVAHNPTSNLKLGSGIARVPDMMGRGINICLGTDGTASNNNLNMFEEIHLAALIHKGVNRNPQLVSAEEAILMATANGAKAVGFGEETGVIKKGMKADLILLDTDKPHFYPMNDPHSAVVYSAQAADVDTVIIDGNILMESRELTTIDEELVKHKVKEISKRILG